MAKKKKKETKRKNSLFIAVITILVVAFLLLIFSDLFKNSSSNRVTKTMNSESKIYAFKKEGELTIRSAGGEFISSLEVEFADNDYERAQGLMYRTELAENQGMLFIFPNEGIQSFYMKNTVLSLDMIFINSDLEIVTIHKKTEPYSEESKPSTKPAQYVLETIAGYTDKYNIKVGDKIVFRQTY